jgi:dipeptidyl aminopeptidase/acylaminoacyl peptidase
LRCRRSGNDAGRRWWRSRGAWRRRVRRRRANFGSVTDGSDNYEPEANQLQAKNLKGKLLLAHGTLDNNVPPGNTELVVDALIKANKDFDLLMIPTAGHGYGGAGNYMMRRRWDYFVRGLLDKEPPAGYEIRPGAGRVTGPAQ